MWTIEWDSKAVKSLKKFDRQARQQIVDKSGLWRYRVGDYRIICNIEDNALVVLVIAVGHRRDVYR